MPKGNPIPEPVNIVEQYLHASVVRLDALCNMMSSLLEHIAEKENVALQEVKVNEQARPNKPRKKSNT